MRDAPPTTGPRNAGAARSVRPLAKSGPRPAPEAGAREPRATVEPKDGAEGVFPCRAQPEGRARSLGKTAGAQAEGRAPASWGNPSAYSSRTGRTEPTITIGKRLADRIRANVTSGVAESREIRSNVLPR